MSQIRVNNITNRTGIAGPTVAGIASVNSNSHFVVPTGRTGQRYADDGENIVRDGLVLYLDAKHSYPSKTGIGTTTSGVAAPAGSSTDVDVYTWYDMSGYENNGQLVGGVGYNAANGGSLVFDGINDFINCGADPELSKSWTISAFVKSSVSSVTGVILQRSGDFSTGYLQNYGIYTTTTNKFGLSTSADGYKGILSTTTMVTNTWYYITGLYDDSAKILSIYINGNFEGSSTTLTQNPPTTGAQYVTLGAGDGLTASNKLTGNIAQASIYNRALTAQEVLQNYNALKGRFGL